MVDIKVLYGVYNPNKNAIHEYNAKLNSFLNNYKYNIQEHICREIKQGVRELVDTKYNKNERVAVILQLYLEQTPFSVSELVYIQNTLPQARIIILYDEKAIAEDWPKTLFSHGFYNGLKTSEASSIEVAKLIVNGREAPEAREYYGIDETQEYVQKISVEDAYRIMTQSTMDETDYLERARYIKKNLTAAEFRECVQRLPDSIKLYLAGTEEFSEYFSEFTKEQLKKLQSEEKRSIDLSADLFNLGDVKSVVRDVVKKNIIGVCGAQQHIGSTHIAISIAHFLAGAGYSVAVLEDAFQERKAFESIAAAKLYKDSRMFKHNGVDYYGDFDTRALYRLNSTQYNFLVVDFGTYNTSVMDRFLNSTLPVVVCGAQDWESRGLENIFRDVAQEQLKHISLLFQSAPLFVQRNILTLKKHVDRVYFSDYMPSPYSDKGCDGIRGLLSEYVMDSPEFANQSNEYDEEENEGITDKLFGFFKRKVSK